MVRPTSQPRGVPGLGRHGRGADDGGADRGQVGHVLRLALRRNCRSASPPGRCCCRPRFWSPSLPRRAAARPARQAANDRACTRLPSPQFAVLALTYFCAARPIPARCSTPSATRSPAGCRSRRRSRSTASRASPALWARRVRTAWRPVRGQAASCVAGLLVQAVAAGCYLFAREQSQFYAVASVFGLAYAGVMPLYAVLVRENFPLPIIGTVIGAANHGIEPGHGARTAGRRTDLRHLRRPTDGSISAPSALAWARPPSC